MAIPILLVSGYLGAGKTTFINRLLSQADGRRIAAIVNDLGAIDIDAALLGAATDRVVSLKNGCICCTLQGDLLRAIANVMRMSQPDAIVIETSGVSDPNEIVRNLLDPVVFKTAALDAVLSLADARHLADNPALYDDPLWLAQLRASDFVLVTKTELVEPPMAAAIGARISGIHPRAAIFMQGEALPIDLLLGQKRLESRQDSQKVRLVAKPAFETAIWETDRLVSLPKFRQALAHLSGSLLRAKGFVTFAEQPERPLLVQIVAGRATVSAAPALHDRRPGSALVIIGRTGQPNAKEILEYLESNCH